MTRFFDVVGYATPTEVVDGVWKDVITEREYKGDVLDIMSSNQEGENANNDVRLQQKISVVADAFLIGNFSDIKYVSWMGTRWTVISVKVERPRLILTLGGVYNGPSPTVASP